MTSGPRPGDPFHLEIEGTAIDGRYVEVDPPHRMLIAWDVPGIEDGTPTLLELTFNPTGDTTSMTVDFTAPSAEFAEFYGPLWRRYLDGISARFGVSPAADSN